MFDGRENHRGCGIPEAFFSWKLTAAAFPHPTGFLLKDKLEGQGGD